MDSAKRHLPFIVRNKFTSKEQLLLASAAQPNDAHSTRQVGGSIQRSGLLILFFVREKPTFDLICVDCSFQLTVSPISAPALEQLDTQLLIKFLSLSDNARPIFSFAQN